MSMSGIAEPMRRLFVALFLGLFLSLPIQPVLACSARDAVARDSNPPEMKKYNGNRNWVPTTIYPPGADDQLGVPHNVGPAAFGPWFNVEGRKVRQVIRRANGAGRAVFQCELIWGRNTQNQPERPPIKGTRGSGGMSFEGLEDDRGRVILPTVYREVRIVPGRGVFIMSHLGDQTYERYDLASGQRTPAIDIAEIADSSLMDGPWRVGVYTMQKSTSLPASEQAKPWRQQARPATLEVFDEAGALVLKRENIQPKPDSEARQIYGQRQWITAGWGKDWPAPQYATPSYNGAASRWYLISYDIVSGGKAHELLDLRFEPVINPLPVAPLRTGFGSRLPIADDSGWAVPLPVGKNLFVPISMAGKLILPEGGIGYFIPDILEPHYFAVFSGQEGPVASLVYYKMDQTGGVDKSVAYQNPEFLETRAEGRAHGQYFLSTHAWLIAQPVNGPWRVIGLGRYTRDRDALNFTAPTREALATRLYTVSVADVQRKVDQRRWEQFYADQRAAEVRAAEKAADDARAARDPRYAAKRAGPAAFAAYLKGLPLADRAYSVEPGIPSLRELLAMPGIASSDADWANQRIRQISEIERQMRQPQVAARSSGYSSAPSTDSWATYRQQSADHQSTLKALQDYTYGRTNQYPFSYYSRR